MSHRCPDCAVLGIDVSVLFPGYVRTNLPHSGSYRGEQFGGQTSRRPSPLVLAALQRALDPRIVGEMTAYAIENRKFLVLTDLSDAKDIVDWHARIAEAINRFDPGSIMASKARNP
jgi:short-subunit dehydrogenase